MSLKNAALFSVFLFSVLSMFLVIQHELHVSIHFDKFKSSNFKFLEKNKIVQSTHRDTEDEEKSSTSIREIDHHQRDPEPDEHRDNEPEVDNDIKEEYLKAKKDLHDKVLDKHDQQSQSSSSSQTTASVAPLVVNEVDKTSNTNIVDSHPPDVAEEVIDNDHKLSQELEANMKPELNLDEKTVYINRQGLKEYRGKLVCNGTQIDSEVVYWKIVPHDEFYESPITPHHDLHHDRYISFEYDAGGWNNVRMGMEIVIVIAHAMGRTLALPPPQHLYLLGKAHKDKHDKEEHDEMGFEDFFDIELLKSHKASHIITMSEFLEREAVTGGLKGKLPPKNSSEIWGNELWHYLKTVADVQPKWYGRFLAMPDRPENFNLTGEHRDPQTLDRMKRFGGERNPVYYDEKLQQAHHIHFPAGDEYRLLQHHYAFTFFADVSMQSFYKRYIRDYMRYKDVIQCSGHELVAAVRADSLAEDPTQNGDFYALHIRRGDFQFKEVKLSAKEILSNLRFENGTSIIPAGALVYISTDDPDGVCVNCYVRRKPCDEYPAGSKPVGCPEDSTWNAFREAGWKLRFLNDYLKRGIIAEANPNTHGMVEAIVSSRAKAFAGTFYSTFTGYIHRLRGYHGIGEDSYYHSNGQVHALRKPKSQGHGFFREWRYGWTDDEGGLI